MIGRSGNAGQPFFFRAVTIRARGRDTALAPVGTTPYSPQTAGEGGAGRDDRSFFRGGGQAR